VSSEILVHGVGVTNKMCQQAICPHNENTDMIVFKGATYLVHRTAVSQILGDNCALHVYKTTDGGATFTHLQQINPVPGRDLRDPAFYVVGDELYMKALTRLPVASSRDSMVDSNTVITHSPDGVTWSTPWEPVTPTVEPGPFYSFWRPVLHDGKYYDAAYQDGDLSTVLYTSTDGKTWTKGSTIYDVSADTVLETELVFMPSGKLLAIGRTDGTDSQLLGGGALMTKMCWASPPNYDTWDCSQTLADQRLDGPVAFWWNSRLFVIARRHLGPSLKKRTSLFELTGNFDGGPLSIKVWGDFPSAGDTAYAGVAPIDANKFLVTWYSSDIPKDAGWGVAILQPSDIWKGVIDMSLVK
jgi:hypothetical protein